MFLVLVVSHVLLDLLSILHVLVLCVLLVVLVLLDVLVKRFVFSTGYIFSLYPFTPATI